MMKRLRAGGHGDGVVYKSPWSQLHEYPKYANVNFLWAFLNFLVVFCSFLALSMTHAGAALDALKKSHLERP